MAKTKYLSWVLIFSAARPSAQTVDSAQVQVLMFGGSLGSSFFARTWTGGSIPGPPANTNNLVPLTFSLGGVAGSRTLDVAGHQ